MKIHKLKHGYFTRGKDIPDKYIYGLKLKGTVKEMVMFQTREDRDFILNNSKERSGQKNIEDYIPFEVLK